MWGAEAGHGARGGRSARARRVPSAPPPAKMTEAEQSLAAIADAEMPDIEVPARLWRVLPYESAPFSRKSK